MWGRKYFYLVPFFLSFWAISGRAFFWGEIYLAALDLRPATPNLRPAHSRALRSAIELYCTGTVQISGRHSGSPLGYFMHISITTPVVSALNNCYMRGFLEVPSDILHHFWIQVAVLPLKPPRGRF
jgi:hypothetical protein